MKLRLLWAVLTLVSSATLYAGKTITFQNVINPTFGVLLGGPSGRNFILGTTGTISGANASEYISGASAGSMRIHGAANQSIDILATNLTAHGGVTIANVTCNYDSGGDQDCDVGFTGAPPRNQGKTLLIGLEINTTQFHTGSMTADPSFDIVVNYI